MQTRLGTGATRRMRMSAPSAPARCSASARRSRAPTLRLYRECYVVTVVFALPGIAMLLVFILVRPQESIPLLQRVPFLHLSTALAVIGYVIDVRLRRLQPVATNTLPWVVALFVWAVISTAINAQEQALGRAVEMAILFALYG